MRLRHFVVVLAAMLPLAISFPTRAFDQFAETCGNNVTRKPNFSGSEWSETGSNGQSLQSLFDQGFDQWRSESRSYDGSYLFTEQNNYTVKWVPNWQAGGAHGFTTCTNPLGVSMKINVLKLSDFKSWNHLRLKGFAAHEWGHAIGLGHSGLKDTWGGWTSDPPTMSTCLNDIFGGSYLETLYRARSSLSQDEQAAVAYLSNQDSNGYHPITANESFEIGKDYWKTLNGSHFSLRTPGLLGTYSIDLYGAGFIYSNTRVANMRQLEGDGHVIGDKYKGRVALRKKYSSDTGHLALSVYRRPVVYLDGNDGGCNFYGDNKNLPDYIGTWIVGTKACIPASTSYAPCDTPTYTVPRSPTGYGSNDEPDAVDMQIRGTNYMQSSVGGTTPARLDRLRVEFKF